MHLTRRVVILLTAAVSAGAQSFSLESAAGLKLHHTVVEPVTHRGRKAIRVTEAPGAPAAAERLAILNGLEFSDGVIEVDLAGVPRTGAGEGARGFVGVAFRVAPDASRLECFYIRPTNGRADDQVRRNHSVQYVSYPDFPWHRLRKETPEKYESYVDLAPGEWTKVRIEVRGDKARLYVHGSAQPVLIVNDLKHGAGTRGSIALWIEPSTEAHFANLRVSR